jgi:hypothetical protein
VVRSNLRQKAVFRHKTVQKMLPASLDCPHCGESIELDDNMKPLVVKAVEIDLAVKPPQMDSSSRLRHLLDQPLPHEIPPVVTPVEPAAGNRLPQKSARAGWIFAPVAFTMAGSLLFLLFALGLGVMVYNSTAPQVTPVIHVSIPTRNPSQEALQNKAVPSDQTQAPVFLPTATTENITVTSIAALTTIPIDVNQPARTTAPTEKPATPSTEVLGPALATTVAVASSEINSAQSSDGARTSAPGQFSNGTGARTTATEPSGNGGGVSATLPALPARTLAPAPAILQVNGQSGRVYQVAFSTDGKLLATANDDNSVRLWDAATGKVGKTLWGHTGPVYTLAFSPDGQFLASAGVDKSILLWNVSSGKMVRKMTGHTAEINAITFSPGGQILATGSSDFSVRLWDVNTGKEVGAGHGHQGAVQTVAFSPDGKALGTGADDQLIMFWDLTSLTNPTQRAVLKGHTSRIFLVTFSPDGKLLASASLDTANNLKVWDLTAGKELVNLSGHDQAVYSVAFSPQGQLLASGGLDRTVRLWDPTSGTLLGTFPGSTGTVTSVAFSPDGKTLAGAGEDQIIRIWKVDAS